jgi:protein-arginine kinase activator protein McsA
MNPPKILDETRKAISNYAGEDSDKWFYANRFVFARLLLDERKTKTHIKKELLEASKACYYCNQSFENKVGVHLHRFDGERCYSINSKVKHRFQPGHRKPSSGTVCYASSGSGFMTVNPALRNPVPIL